MLKNITIGQYFPGDSFVHRLDPRTKLLATIALIAIVFVSKGFAGFDRFAERVDILEVLVGCAVLVRHVLEDVLVGCVALLWQDAYHSIRDCD